MDKYVALWPPSGKDEELYAFRRYAFLKQQAPPSYVAGLGRGASGFTTRSDIGPAREGPSAETVAAARAARGEGDDEEPDGAIPEQFQDPENETNLFGSVPYDQEDEEADRIYESVDAALEKRGRARREAREKAEQEELERTRPKIQTQFADLKRNLGQVTDSEWENLPEVGNLAGRGHKKLRKEGRDRVSYAVPDSVLLGQRDQVGMESSISDEQMNGDTPVNGRDAADGAMTNFAEIGAARDKVLSLRLDQAKDSLSGQTTIDPKGYLTQMDSIIHKTDAEIGDIKRARALLDSLIKSNRTHAPGWIAAARVEVAAGKQVAARKIMAQACEECPKSEDAWLENANLNVSFTPAHALNSSSADLDATQNPENARVILANAVTHLPNSVKIWLKAVSLEREAPAKKRVLLKALEYIPTSVKLWKEVVNLEENPADARTLLQRAVEVVPYSDELWLTLARLETPQRAQQVLNKARKTIPTSHQIWIAAARLLEQEGSEAQVDVLMEKGVAALRKNGAELTREQWIREAERCETSGSVATCQAIIKASIHLDVEEDTRKEVWVEDAQSSLANGYIETARAIFAYALQVLPNKADLWRKAADLEKSHGSRESLLALLERAVGYVPHAEVLWLMAAKECWQGGDVEAARKILGDAFSANPESEQVWLAAVKLESENGQLEAAKQLMKRARDVAGTERIWMKNADFERRHGSVDEALKIVEQALVKFPTADKLYMIKGQILEGKGEVAAAREAYTTGTRKCPRSVPLWILLSRLEEKAGLAIKARAIMERARHANPKSDVLWAESCAIEERSGGTAQAKNMMARALQDCPASGLLYAQAIWYEPRPQRKARAVDALKKCNNDPRVIVTVARLFWQERKIDKARSWFERACNADPDLGDSWGIWYKFEQAHGTPVRAFSAKPVASLKGLTMILPQDEREKVVAKCVAAEPHHGPVWQATAKDLANSGKDTFQILSLVAEQLQS